jgi:hypothetical protein
MDVEASDRLEPKSMTKFSVIFAGQAFSLFGSRLVQFALVWWLTSTSGLASTLALASIMNVEEEGTGKKEVAKHTIDESSASHTF